MSIRGIHHVQIALPPGREPEARAFYQGLLGIPEVPKPPNLAARGGCWFEQESVRIHLGVEAEFRPARKAHTALLVGDLATLITTLESAGHRVRAGEPLEGFVRGYVDDPFGNRIELLQSMGPRKK